MTGYLDKRDQRGFSDQPIPEDTLGRILQAGRMTGTGRAGDGARCRVVCSRPGPGRAQTERAEPVREGGSC